MTFPKYGRENGLRGYFAYLPQRGPKTKNSRGPSAQVIWGSRVKCPPRMPPGQRILGRQSGGQFGRRNPLRRNELGIGPVGQNGIARGPDQQCGVARERRRKRPGRRESFDGAPGRKERRVAGYWVVLSLYFSASDR